MSSMKDIVRESADVVVYEPMGMPRLDVLLSRDSIWMTMQQMGLVFGVDRSVIGKHIRNIYKTGELEQISTWAKIAQVQKEGKREVTREVPFYNLDVIIAVGYRVNSFKATRFRQWATSVIKEYLLNGRAVNKELAETKKRLAEHEKRLSKVELGVETIIHTLMPPIVNRKPIGFNAER